MTRLFHRTAARTSLALALLATLALAGCASREERAQSYYQNGMKLLAAHENAKAAIEFRNALKLKKDLVPAWRGLDQTEEAIQHWEGVVPILRAILELDPKDGATRIKLAKLLLLGGSVDESLKLVNDATDPEADGAGLHALKAVIFYKLKDSPNAIREAQAALKLEPGNVDALMVLAADRLANNDPKAALQLLASEAAAPGKDLGVQLFKIKIYEQLKDFPQIEALLRKLAEAYPQEPAFGKQLVRFYMDQKRPQDAENEVRAMAADPKNSEAGLDLVRFLFTVKGPPAAREELVARINGGGDVFPYQLALAEFDYAQGKVDDSFQLLAKLGADTASPAHALTAKIKLAQLNLARRNVDAADKIVADVLAKDGRNVDGLKLRASIRLARGEFEPAISDLREALNDQPRSSELMLMLATAYERSGSIELADKEYADATKASNFEPGVGLAYVTFLRRRGSIDHADEILTELANRWPGNLDVLSVFAEVKLARQDWAGAQQIADAMRRIGDTHGIADQVLGAALSGRNKYDDSIAAFQNAVAASPSAVQPMVSLVGALMRAKRPDRAITFLQSVLKSNPGNAEAYTLLGSVQLANNTPDQAAKSFQAAIDKQPKDAIGYRALADLYLGQKKLDPALGVIRAGLKEQPDSAVLHMALAGALEQKGDFEGAITEYENLLNQQPTSMIISNNLASMLADHRTDKASLERAQSLAASLRKSQVPQFKDTLGWVTYRQGDLKAAVPLLEAAATELPNVALVHYHLGMGYVGIGQPAKASEQFRLALARAPDAELETKIKNELKNIVTQ